MEDYQVKESAIQVLCFGTKLAAVSRSHAARAKNKILFIGYEFTRKGGETLLAAFVLVKKALPQAELIIAGPQRPAVVPTGVTWLGKVKDRQKIASIFQEAAVFVLPSFCEPFGLVFLEAMAYGLPCIGSRRDAMPEIIQEGETGFLVEPDDVNDLAAKIIQLLTDDQLRQRMGSAAEKRLNEHFTWDLMGKRVTSAIKNLAARC